MPASEKYPSFEMSALRSMRANRIKLKTSGCLAIITSMSSLGRTSSWFRAPTPDTIPALSSDSVGAIVMCQYEVRIVAINSGIMDAPEPYLWGVVAVIKSSAISGKLSAGGQSSEF